VPRLPACTQVIPLLFFAFPRPQCSDGADDGKGGRVPTLLTSQAAECCISICTALAQQYSELDGEHEGAVDVGSRGGVRKGAAAHRERRVGRVQEDGDGPLRALVQLSRSMSLVLREMGGWYAAKRPLLSQGLVAFSQVGISLPSASTGFPTWHLKYCQLRLTLESTLFSHSRPDISSSCDSYVMFHPAKSLSLSSRFWKLATEEEMRQTNWRLDFGASWART
jgi:hypothetical protein